MMESQDPNPPFSTTTSTAPPSSSSPKFQPPHDFLSMMATAVPAAAPEDGMDASRAVGPMSLGSALSSQQGTNTFNSVLFYKPIHHNYFSEFEIS